MKYIDEYRDKEICKKFSDKIHKISPNRDITFMEVCGTHTMSIARSGIKKLLPKNIRLLSGPGCPVCVTPNSGIDKAIAYAKMENTIITTFGDMMRVPGSSSSLAREKSLGGDVKIVYSASDALSIAQENPAENVIFLGVGFETTSPTIAASIKDAALKKIDNYSVLPMFKLIPPAIRAILNSGELTINGFLLPGHVSSITGTGIYRFISNEYGVSGSVTGFEPLDILQSILILLRQINDGKSEIANQYKRAVKQEGNQSALSLLKEVFETEDTEWRGIGFIKESGLKIRERYGSFDAERKIPVEAEVTKENPECICGDILRGVKIPSDCKLFDKVCNPENPIGPCMVSSEGTCAAYYKYER